MKTFKHLLCNIIPLAGMVLTAYLAYLDEAWGCGLVLVFVSLILEKTERSYQTIIINEN